MKKSRQCFLRLFLSLVLLISSIPGVNQGVNSFAQQDQKKEPEVQQGGPQKEETDTIVRPKKEAPPKKRRLNPKKPTGDKPEDNFTLSVEIELVNLDVSVTDKKGNFIPNLSPKNRSEEHTSELQSHSE